MKEKYYCTECKKFFNKKGEKKEWNDPVYGACMKYIAECPDCHAECNEYREPSQKKSSAEVPISGCGNLCHSCEFAN